MNETSEITGTIESIAGNGMGVLHSGGRAYFIAGTAPGDIVRAEITGGASAKAYVKLLDVLQNAHCRRTPHCKYYGVCGGCSLQHIDYQTQLTQKTKILEDALVHIGKFTPQALPQIKVVAGIEWEYRNRVQLHRDAKTGSIGFEGRNSNTIVPIGDCPVAVPEIRNALKGSLIKAPPAAERFTVYAKDGVLLCENETPEYQRRGNMRYNGRTREIDAGVFFQSNAEMLE